MPTSFLPMGYPATFGYNDASLRTTSMFASLKLKSTGKTSAAKAAPTQGSPGNEGPSGVLRPIGDRDDDGRGSSEKGILDFCIYALGMSLDVPPSPGIQDDENTSSKNLDFAVYSDRIVKASCNLRKRRTTITIYPINDVPSSPNIGAHGIFHRNLVPGATFDVPGFTMPRLHHSLPVIATFSRVSVDFSTLGTQVDAIDEVHVHDLDGNRIAKHKGWFRDPGTLLTKWLSDLSSEAWPKLTLTIVQPPDGVVLLDVNEWASSTEAFTKINTRNVVPPSSLEGRHRDSYVKTVDLTEMCEEGGREWVRTWKTNVKAEGMGDSQSNNGATDAVDLYPDQPYTATQLLTELKTGNQLEIWGTKALVLTDESCAGLDGPVCIWAGCNLEKGASSINVKIGQIVSDETGATGNMSQRRRLSVKNVRTCRIFGDGLNRDRVEWAKEIYLSKRLEILFLVTSYGAVHLIDLVSFKVMEQKRLNIQDPRVGMVAFGRGVWLYDPHIGLHVVSISSGQEERLKEAQLRIRSRMVI
ncbi:hypothetical protein FRC02_004967 [Tulasnella sp. 418]|nr:hypothetical protein FRC02_004967 [Tulasnella sp. 418]